MSKPTLLIMAAGIGSRYGGLKQVEKVGHSGETILEYSIYDAIRAGFGKVVFIIRKDIERVFNELFVEKLKDKIDVSTVFQNLELNGIDKKLYTNRSKPWGTGHAILVAENEINEPFAVINADDFYGAGSFQLLGQFLSSDDVNESRYSNVTYLLNETVSEYGTVSRGVCTVNDDSFLTNIIERKKIETSGTEIYFINDNNQKVILSSDEKVSMNMWGFHQSLFTHLEKSFDDFLESNISDPKAEFLIPEVVMNLIKRNEISVKALVTEEKWLGITYQEDKAHVIKMINDLVEKNIYPENLWG
jgi:UTP-glucose-1-phosphate uridylyltransferase